eukprot:1153656-Pelagomonas_calceolata.AAC.2
MQYTVKARGVCISGAKLMLLLHERPQPFEHLTHEPAPSPKPRTPEWDLCPQVGKCMRSSDMPSPRVIQHASEEQLGADLNKGEEALKQHSLRLWLNHRQGAGSTVPVAGGETESVHILSLGKAFDQALLLPRASRSLFETR